MADENSERLPAWAFLVLLFGGLAGLFFVIVDPLHMIPDDQAVALSGTLAAVVSAILGPAAVKRL